MNTLCTPNRTGYGIDYTPQRSLRLNARVSFPRNPARRDDFMRQVGAVRCLTWR
jgi:hypothetical protein